LEVHIVQGVSDLLSGTQTIMIVIFTQLLQVHHLILIDILNAANASDALNNIKMFSKFSKA
jgi:hypothetical protein